MKKKNDGENAWVHLGILPFITCEEAWGAVKGAYDQSSGGTGERFLAEILSVLDGKQRDYLSIAFQMRLSDKKVYRQFGKNPERGKVLNWLPKQKVTVGFTHKFGKMKPDTDVRVSPCVRLVKNAPGQYTVEVAERHKKQVMEWLHANCT